MSKCSTIHELVMSDIRESNARNKRSRNQRRHKSVIEVLVRSTKCHYRRDRVLRRLLDLNMKKLVKEMTK